MGESLETWECPHRAINEDFLPLQIVFKAEWSPSVERVHVIYPSPARFYVLFKEVSMFYVFRLCLPFATFENHIEGQDLPAERYPRRHDKCFVRVRRCRSKFL